MSNRVLFPQFIVTLYELEMLDLRSLQVFSAVARSSGFGAAAHKLNMTQPAVSGRIARLELALGVRLLDRTTRSVALTPQGRILLEWADRLFGLHDEMVAAVIDPSQRSGTLRLGVAESVAHTWLPALVEQTASAYPRLVLEIEIGLSSDLRDGLIARQLDLAVLVGPLSAPTLIQEPICRLPLAFLVSPKLKLKSRGTRLADIAAHPIITFARNSLPYVRLTEMLRAAGLRQTHIHTSASVAMIVKMASDGLGIAAIPPAVALAAIADGTLEVIDTRERMAPLLFVAAWPAGGDQTVARRLMEMAKEAAQPWHARRAPRAKPLRTRKAGRKS